MKKSERLLFLLMMGFTLGFTIFTACTPKPEPIEYGNDTCNYCRMLISDQRYGAELVTKKGKMYKYDSVECLAAEYLKETIPHAEIHSMWVADFNTPGKLINAREAIYFRSPQLHSPMGLNITALANRQMAENVKNMFPGEFLSWEEVLKIVDQEWLQNQ